MYATYIIEFVFPFFLFFSFFICILNTPWYGDIAVSAVPFVMQCLLLNKSSNYWTVDFGCIHWFMVDQCVNKADWKIKRMIFVVLEAFMCVWIPYTPMYSPFFFLSLHTTVFKYNHRAIFFWFQRCAQIKWTIKFACIPTENDTTKN